MTEPTHAQAVAALRAYADWLEAHPDVPTPQYLQAVTHHHQKSISVAESERIAQALVDTYGAVKKRGGVTRWVELTQTFPGSPMRVEQTLYVHSPKPAEDTW